MPDRFPLEHFYRAHHPDAWYEYWQDNDIFYGHLDMPEKQDDPYMDSGNNYDTGPTDFGWPGQDYGEIPYGDI